MSSIFKTEVLPNINLKTLDATEQYTLITILELLDITDAKVYKEIKNRRLNNLNTTFTNTLAQNIYYYPKLYSNTQQGTDFVLAWLPLVKQGFFPDKKSTELFIHFFKFNLNYFQSEQCEQTIIDSFFEIITLLVKSKSEASLIISRFLIDSLFDLANVLNLNFLVQCCLDYNILNDSYTVIQNKEAIQTYPFKINDTFITHFFNGNWQEFINAFHNILPVGKVYQPDVYNVVSSWFTSDLADYYLNNPLDCHKAHQAIKERWIFGEVKSTALLNIKTNQNNYPLINALSTKPWDSGDVILFNNREKTIPQNQLDSCYQQLIEWLKHRPNYNTEVFTDFAKPLLNEATASVLPLTSLAFWFNTCHPKSGIKNQTETYNAIFSKLLLDDNQNALPSMRYQNETFKLTGAFLITHVFQNTNNLDAFLKGFEASGIVNPLNQFLVRMFYDANQELFNCYTLEQQETLQLYLLNMAYSATKTTEAITTKNLPYIVKTLTVLCRDAGNYTRVNQIWALKDINPCVTDLCNAFAGKHYLNQDNPLTLNLIQAWFNYLLDYYYSFKQEAVWTKAMLTTQGVRTANFFNAVEDDVSYFLDKTIKRLVSIHQKSKKTAHNSVASNDVWEEIEVFLVDFLGALKHTKLSAKTVTQLVKYDTDTSNAFTSKNQLNTIISTFNDAFFNQNTATTNSLNTPSTSQVILQPKEINHKFISYVLSNLENYTRLKTYDTESLSFLVENITTLKTWLEDDKTHSDSRFTQALYSVILDAELASNPALSTFNNHCQTLFVELVKDTKMASSYAMGLKTMLKSGAFPDHVSKTISQVIIQLKA